MATRRGRRLQTDGGSNFATRSRRSGVGGPSGINLSRGCYFKRWRILNVAPSEALMVGNRVEDQEAARAAGVPFRWATTDWMLW